jgi:siroheme synthase-like protein
MKLYPVMLNVSGRRICVIGGGKVAFRKIQDIMDCGAIITVISPEVLDLINGLAETEPEKINIIKRPYQHGDLEGALMVFSATNDELVNREVFREAVEKNIFINAVDDPSNCSFFVPSTFNRGDLIVAVSTSGVSPYMASRIRKDIEKTIPDSITDTLEVLKRVRMLIKDDEYFKDILPEKRGIILKHIVNSSELLSELLKCKDDDSLKKIIFSVSDIIIKPGYF